MTVNNIVLLIVNIVLIIVLILILYYGIKLVKSYQTKEGYDTSVLQRFSQAQLYRNHQNALSTTPNNLAPNNPLYGASTRVNNKGYVTGYDNGNPSRVKFDMVETQQKAVSKPSDPNAIVVGNSMVRGMNWETSNPGSMPIPAGYTDATVTIDTPIINQIDTSELPSVEQTGVVENQTSPNGTPILNTRQAGVVDIADGEHISANVESYKNSRFRGKNTIIRK